MNREQIIQMARDASASKIDGDWIFTDIASVERFAAAIRASK